MALFGICVNRLKLTGWDLELSTINVEENSSDRILLHSHSLKVCSRHAFTCFIGTPLHPLSIFTPSMLIVVSDFEDFHSLPFQMSLRLILWCLRVTR